MGLGLWGQGYEVRVMRLGLELGLGLWELWLVIIIFLSRISKLRVTAETRFTC